MLVHVKRPNGSVFQTVAFAIIYGKELDTEFFIMDENDEFERVFAYKQGTKEIIPQVVVFDVFRFNAEWLKEDDREGYKEFIHNPKLLDRIRNGEKRLFDDEMMYLWYSLTGASGHELDYGPFAVDDKKLSKI